jgi:hypothetical protein
MGGPYISPDLEDQGSEARKRLANALRLATHADQDPGFTDGTIGAPKPFTLPDDSPARVAGLEKQASAIPASGVQPVHGIKDALMHALTTFLPIAIAGKMGGLPAASGAARGAFGAEQEQGQQNLARRSELLKQAETERGRGEHAREFNIGQEEKQREFTLNQQDRKDAADERAYQHEQGRTPYSDFRTGDPAKQKTAKDFMQAGQDVKPDPIPKAPQVSYDSGIPVSVTDGKGKVFDVNDPSLPPELKPLVQAAGRAHSQHVTEDSNKQAAAFRQQQTMHDEKQTDLTAATKSMVEAAPGVITLANRVKQLMAAKDAKGNPVLDLGPGASRWQEFMAGKVGSSNAEFTKLRTDIGLLSTKLMRMHVGARGGELIMQHFKDLIDSGKQSPENLNAALDEIIQYAQDTAGEGKGGGGKEFTLPSSGGATKTYQGATYKQQADGSWSKVAQ